MPVDYREKLKESETKDKYLNLACEWKNKKQWNMKVTIIPNVIGALGTDTKGLIKGLKDVDITGRIETVQTPALLRSPRTLRRNLETWGDACHSNSSGKPSANDDVKNSQWLNNNNNNNKNNDPIYQPLHSGRIWHKVNFWAEFIRFEFRVLLLLD